MAIYCINYDLSAPGRDYAKIAAGIEKVSSDSIRPLQSCWLVSTNMDRAEVRKVLCEHVDANDPVLVVEVILKDWIEQGLDTSSVKWLLRHSASETSPPVPEWFASFPVDPPFPPPEWGYDRLTALGEVPAPPVANELLHFGELIRARKA